MAIRPPFPAFGFERYEQVKKAYEVITPRIVHNANKSDTARNEWTKLIVDFNNTTKVLSWIPVISIVVGVARGFFTLYVGDRMNSSDEHEPMLIRKTIIHLTRALCEIACLGPVLALIDIGVTVLTWKKVTLQQKS